jgi:hypothetical protein
MAKKKQAETESQGYTCPNASCGRVFVNPLKTENVSSKNVAVYDACPYCLTEITVKKESEITEDVQEPKVNAEGLNSKPAKSLPTEKRSSPSPTKVQGCIHHFGYLSQRSKKEKIPEECMVCENIVQCMLKNVTG